MNIDWQVSAEELGAKANVSDPSAQARDRAVYLDHHASTPVDARVATLMFHVMTTTFGNANSVDHIFGEEAAKLVVRARKEVAALVGATADDVHFTSGASESLRLAVRHVISARRSRSAPCRIVVSSVEHRALFDALQELEARGDALVYQLPVDQQARLDMIALNEACARGVDLVCVMAANNEVGTVYPIADIARIAAANGAWTLVDATQAAGRVPLCVRDWGVTYLALSAHKMYGPKGIGALVTERRDVRPSHSPTAGVGDGTPNVPGIAGLGEACRLRRLEMSLDEPRIAALRDALEAELRACVPDLHVNGDVANRLSHNLHVSAPGVPNDAVVARLRRRVAISTGAACMSGAQTPSHVLRAMGLAPALQEGALRISLGRLTTGEEVSFAAEQIATAIQATRLAMERR
jgi:cysteine desulfurase